jgi:hypothetical protein
MAAKARAKARANTARSAIFFICESPFFVEVELLNCTNCNPVRNQEPSSAGALNSGLASEVSGLQLDLVIA